jgi:hypothetical protein
MNIYVTAISAKPEETTIEGKMAVTSRLSQDRSQAVKKARDTTLVRKPETSEGLLFVHDQEGWRNTFKHLFPNWEKVLPFFAIWEETGDCEPRLRVK